MKFMRLCLTVVVLLLALVVAQADVAPVCGCKSNTNGRVSRIPATVTPPTCPSSRTLVCWNETALPGDSSVSAYASALTPVPSGPAYFYVPFDSEYYDTDT